MGGLQGKIFRLCITLVIVATAVFTLLGMLQLHTLEKMANDTAKSEAKRVKDQSEDSMMQMTEANMKFLVAQAAENTDWEIWEISNEAVILAEQVKDVFEHPGNYGRHGIELPEFFHVDVFCHNSFDRLDLPCGMDVLKSADRSH